MNKKILNIYESQKGTTLLLALLILAVIFAIALGVSNIILNQIKITGRVEESVLALYAADTGIECKLYEVFKNQQNPCDTYLPNFSFIKRLVYSSSTTSSFIESIGQYILTARGIKIEW